LRSSELRKVFLSPIQPLESRERYRCYAGAMFLPLRDGDVCRGHRSSCRWWIDLTSSRYDLSGLIATVVGADLHKL
jgi:hypothetical protein